MSNEKFAIEVGPKDVPHDTEVAGLLPDTETSIERGRRVEAAIRDILGDGATDVQLALMSRVATMEETLQTRCAQVVDQAIATEAKLSELQDELDKRVPYQLNLDRPACQGCAQLQDELLEYRKWWTSKAEEIYTRINEHERLLSVVGTGRRDENTAQALLDRVRELVQPR